MSRDQEEQFEQDRLGNVRRKLDELRAREGNVDADPNDGLRVLTNADTGTDLALMSKPTHADEIIVTEISAFNSAPGGNNTFHLIEGEPDGSGGLSATTRRSVDHDVSSASSRVIDYTGEPFEESVGVRSDFGGQIAVGVIVDHHESSEPQSEQ